MFSFIQRYKHTYTLTRYKGLSLLFSEERDKFVLWEQHNTAGYPARISQKFCTGQHSNATQFSAAPEQSLAWISTASASISQQK